MTAWHVFLCLVISCLQVAPPLAPCCLRINGSEPFAPEGTMQNWSVLTHRRSSWAMGQVGGVWRCPCEAERKSNSDSHSVLLNYLAGRAETLYRVRAIKLFQERQKTDWTRQRPSGYATEVAEQDRKNKEPKVKIQFGFFGQCQYLSIQRTMKRFVPDYTITPSCFIGSVSWDHYKSHVSSEDTLLEAVSLKLKHTHTPP